MHRQFLAITCILGQVLGASYSRDQQIVGTTFNSAFEYEAIADPTNGRVQYVDKSTAQSLNLTYASGSTFILRADHTTVLSSSGAGRKSVRMRTLKQYSTHVAVFNIRHMPQGCGTWPAVWETDEANWPNKGEIDILEGVNDVSPNQATLHTTSGCTMPASRTETGTPQQNDCNWAVNSNAGCGVRLTGESNTYGPGFNNNGGGFYAVERTNSFIKGSSVNTDNWGTPSAYFPNTSCNFPSFFGPNNIIINLTLCGDWAGATFNGDGCSGTCVDYVNNNPSAFTNAYFDFASINIYT
ncbi:laminarinase [Flagelloscypha sp. PMI_526]|nr:laminarinase [Flagelloscypha sp. PMI_526]